MKKILSIDGGGIKGLMPAIFLEILGRCLNEPLVKTFDLVTGTSTGSVLAGAIAFPVGLDMAGVQKLYREQGPRIFRNPRPDIVQLTKPKYRGSNLYNVLKMYFKDMRLSKAGTRFMSTAYDVFGAWDKDGNPGPVFFKSWRRNMAKVRVIDAIQASAAAPTYFPPHRVDVPWKPTQRACLYDGGLFAGNPTLTALAEAERLFPGEQFFIVSMGTGRHETVTKCRNADGLINVATKVTGWMLDGSADTVDYIMNRIHPADAYFRFNPVLDRKVTMDDAGSDTLDYLTGVAQLYLKNNRKRFKALCKALNNLA